MSKSVVIGSWTDLPKGDIDVLVLPSTDADYNAEQILCLAKIIVVLPKDNPSRVHELISANLEKPIEELRTILLSSGLLTHWGLTTGQADPWKLFLH